jgi:hypothetical protein
LGFWEWPTRRFKAFYRRQYHPVERETSVGIINKDLKDGIDSDFSFINIK